MSDLPLLIDVKLLWQVGFGSLKETESFGWPGSFGPLLT